MALADELAQEADRVSASISADAPAGRDVSLEPPFESIKAEIEKLQHVSGIAPDWRKVEQLSFELLTTQSKDLRLGVWLAAARMRLHDWRGLAWGLAGVHALCSRCWETMLPDLRRLRGRANLYAWITEQGNSIFESKVVALENAEAVIACEELLTKLDELMSDKLGEMSPGPGRLRGTLRNAARAARDLMPHSAPAQAGAPGALVPAPAAAPAPAPTPAAAPSAAVATSVAAAPPVAVAAPVLPATASAADVSAVLSACANALIGAADVLQAANAKNPLGYRLRRLGVWLDVDDAPGDGLLPGPDDAIVSGLQAHVSKSRFDQLLKDAEDAFSAYPFWIDVHHYSVIAAKGLGLTDVAHAVSGELAGFVTRLPATRERSFNTGMPFASPDTLAWLGREVIAGSGGGGRGADGGEGATASEIDPLEKVVDDAKGLLREKKFGDAISIIVAAARRAESTRDRFRGLLRAGRFALEAGAPQLARPILEGLCIHVDRHDLEQWDPALCSQLYVDLIHAMRRESEGGIVDHSSREGVLFEKLCRLDPKAALSLAAR